MARNFSLRQYQEDILARIKVLAEAPDVQARSRLGVRAGRQKWLVRLDDICEVVSVPEIHAVPLTRPWFLGMTNVRGNLYGVSDLAQLTRQAPATLGADCRILLAHPKYKANVGLLVGAVLGLRSLDQMQAGEAVDRAHSWEGTQTWQDAGGDAWPELDMKALLQAPDFLHIGVA